ncbi:MAG: diaminobutyrate--2-oxoglutarate transaminase [Myxococcales bacterium]|jgi:diaminobutyrate-2-oxoglutarate transaminase|nr:diaminobutyrate--2-oxoglutarate transaminase [Myxococcales bacterium]
MTDEIVHRLESEVRSYCRSFPVVFQRAQGAELFDERGRSYLDFFAGAGTLNYGHNDPTLKERLIEYIAGSGITHGLDMTTSAKCRFLELFEARILKPRKLDYKVMFPGPTGANAVEASLKLARKVTGRSNVISFTNAFHGMTLGALAATGNGEKRAGAGVALSGVTRMPFDGYLGPTVDTLDYLEKALDDPSSGVDAPAALIVETIQAEGGVNVGSIPWLRRLERIARSCGALLIVDDIQVGCGRTGPFFSFERAGLKPDIVCLSKSLSGYGLPLAVVLMRPELDVWKPGEHNGTFRGHNLAFVTAAAALETYWADDELTRAVDRRATIVGAALGALAAQFPAEVRGRGLIQGLLFQDPELASRAARKAFERGLVIETAGPRDEVLKVLPPLTISDEQLSRGLEIMSASVAATLAESRRQTERPRSQPPARSTEVNAS